MLQSINVIANDFCSLHSMKQPKMAICSIYEWHIFNYGPFEIEESAFLLKMSVFILAN
jgi:hypothetical protein